MNPEQFIALLLVIADQRITIEQLKAQLAKTEESNGRHAETEPSRHPAG